MKRFVILSLLIYLTHLRESLAADISLTTNSLYIVIAGDRPNSIGIVTNEAIRFDDRLLWMPFCETGQVELSYPLDPAYGVKIKMTDVMGREVPKTGLGDRYGTKYDRLHVFTDTHVYPCLAEGSFKDNIGLGGAKFLPAPGELFQIEKPGVYTLEIQMQMFRVIKDTNEWSRKLFQFSPLKIKVEKPPDN
jgi:hypothetical protein